MMRFLRPAVKLFQSPPRALVRTSGAFSQRHFSYSTPRRALGSPLNIPKWCVNILGITSTYALSFYYGIFPLTRLVNSRVAENSHMLKPPINNYCVYNDDVTVMIVGGPNERTDYHINETPEWFYQHKGSMLLKVVDDSQPADQQFRDIDIHEGDMFLLPANTPHNPVRFKDTVGVVLEQKRPGGSMDRLRWYCQGCGDKVHEAAFHCTDLGTQIKDAVNAFKADNEARTCKNCGTLCDTAPQAKA